MNIEQTKKMNIMIKELTKTGTVTNFDDAVAMAGNMYEEGLPETPQVIAEESDRMRDLVDRRIRFNLAGLTDNINSELKRVWDALEDLKKAPQPHEPKDIDSTKEITEEKVQETQNTEEGCSHPRNGSYNSEDVSLEKFFYFGEK